MSFLDRRLTTKPSHIHIDPSSIVINIHLTSGHEDTGTSFWRPLQQDAEHRARAQPGSPRVEFCGGEEWNLMWCTHHLHRHSKELRRRLSTGEPIPFPAGTDFTEEFEQVRGVLLVRGSNSGTPIVF